VYLYYRVMSTLQNFLDNNLELKLENERDLASILYQFLKYGWGNSGDPDKLGRIAIERWSGNMAKLIEKNKTREDKMERFIDQYLVMRKALDYKRDRKNIFSLEQIVDLIHPYTSRDDLPFAPPTRAAGEGEIGFLTGVIHITPKGRLNFSYRKQLNKYDPPFRNFERHKYYKGNFKPLYRGFSGVNWEEEGKDLMYFDSEFTRTDDLNIFDIFKIAKVRTARIETFFTTEGRKRKVYFSEMSGKIVSEMRDHNFEDYEIQGSVNAIGLI